MQNFIELIITRLCRASTFSPVTVTLNCEQILCDLAPLDPVKYLSLILTHASVRSCDIPTDGDDAGDDGLDQSSSSYPTFNSSSSTIEKSRQGEGVTSAHERLVALHTMSVAIQHMTSSQVLEKIEQIVATVIPSLSSVLADLRKAVIMVLVEIYFVIGDAMYPYVQELAPPHRKLLTIYVDKTSEERSNKRAIS